MQVKPRDHYLIASHAWCVILWGSLVSQELWPPPPSVQALVEATSSQLNKWGSFYLQLWGSLLTLDSSCLYFSPVQKPAVGFRCPQVQCCPSPGAPGGGWWRWKRQIALGLSPFCSHHMEGNSSDDYGSAEDHIGWGMWTAFTKKGWWACSPHSNSLILPGLDVISLEGKKIWELWEGQRQCGTLWKAGLLLTASLKKWPGVIIYA
jgi:hypothetical protein